MKESCQKGRRHIKKRKIYKERGHKVKVCSGEGELRKRRGLKTTRKKTVYLKRGELSTEVSTQHKNLEMMHREKEEHEASISTDEAAILDNRTSRKNTDYMSRGRLFREWTPAKKERGKIYKESGDKLKVCSSEGGLWKTRGLKICRKKTDDLSREENRPEHRPRTGKERNA